MTFGDPYKFAILIDPIKAWNLDDTFCNGLLFLCVNGSLYPKEPETAPLRYEVTRLKQNLSHLAVDKQIYALPPQQAFAEIYRMTFPETVDAERDLQFDLSPTLCSDRNCFLFAVCDGAEVRILASQLDYNPENSRHNLQTLHVNEAFLSVDEWTEIRTGLERYSLDNP